MRMETIAISEGRNFVDAMHSGFVVTTDGIPRPLIGYRDVHVLDIRRKVLISEVVALLTSTIRTAALFDLHPSLKLTKLLPNFKKRFDLR